MASEIRKFYRFGGFCFDSQTHCLKFGDELVQLPPKSLETLAVLIENRGDVVTRETILDSVWEQSYVDDANLTVAVSSLRKSLAAYNGQEDYIQTISRKGYRFTAQVEEKIEMLDESIVVSRHSIESLSINAEAPISLSGRTTNFKLAMAVGIVIAAFVVFGILAAFQRLSVKAAPTPARTVAVLPLKNLTGNADDNFMVDGITESVITELAKIRGLTVISRNSAFLLRDQEKDPAKLSSQLGISHLIEGSVRRDGEVIRVETRLIDAANGEVVWTESYERRLDNVVSVQDGIACSVAGELRIAICGERDRLAPRYTTNLKAYQAFLKGQFYRYERGAVNYEKAIAEYKKAIGFDVSYAPAYAALAKSYAVQEANAYVTPGSSLENAVTNANAALKLDNELPESYQALGLVAQLTGRFGEADEFYQRSIDVNPNAAGGWSLRASLMSIRGDLANAEEHLKKARDLDPLSIGPVYSLGDIYIYQREFGKALAQGDAIFEISPDAPSGHVIRALALNGLGRYDEALAEADKAKIDGSDYLKAQIVAGSGDRVGTLRSLTIFERSEIAIKNPYRIAVLYSLIHENDKAFEWLERAREIKQPYLSYIRNEPSFDPIRTDPRYPDLIARLNLPN